MLFACFCFFSFEYVFKVKIVGPTTTQFTYTYVDDNGQGETETCGPLIDTSSCFIQISTNVLFHYSFDFGKCQFDQEGYDTKNNIIPEVGEDYLKNICTVKAFPQMLAMTYLNYTNEIQNDDIKLYAKLDDYIPSPKGIRKSFTNKGGYFNLELYATSSYCQDYTKIGYLRSTHDINAIFKVTDSSIPATCLPPTFYLKVKNSIEGDYQLFALDSGNYKEIKKGEIYSKEGESQFSIEFFIKSSTCQDYTSIGKVDAQTDENYIDAAVDTDIPDKCKPSGGGNSGDGDSNEGESDVYKEFNPYKTTSFINVVSSQNKDQCEKQKSQIPDLVSKCETVKKDDEEFKDCQVIVKLKDARCAVTDKVNDELKNVPSNVDLLIVFLQDIPSGSIDFNQLKGTHVVYLAGPSEEKISEPLNVIKRLLKQNKKKDNQHKQAKSLINGKRQIKETTPVQIEGGIGSHVPFLMISSLNDDNRLNFKVTGKDKYLDPETLVLNNVRMIKDTNLYKVKYLITGGISYLAYAEKYKMMEQFGYMKDEAKSYEIVYKPDKMEYTSDTGEVSELNTKYPHDITSIVSKTKNYVLKNAEDESILRPINITVLDMMESLPEVTAVKTNLKVKTLAKEKITIKSEFKIVSGGENYKIYINYDKSKYELDTSGLDDSLKSKVVETDSFKYENKKEDDNNNNNDKKGTNIGLIVGIVVAVVVVVIIIIVVVVVVVKKKKKVGQSQGSESP